MTTGTSDRVAGPAPESGRPDLWPFLLGGGLLLALQVLGHLDRGFTWDEAVYVSQVTPDRASLYWGPTRAQGLAWLVAPVVVLTDSLTALRGYLAVVGTVLTVGAFWSWSRALGRRAAGLGLLVASSLWLTSYFVTSVFPNLYVAVGLVGVAGTLWGLVLDDSAPLARWAGLVGWTALAVVVRPTDAGLGLAGIGLGTLAAVAWQYRDRLRRAVTVLGVAAGAAVVALVPWLVESFRRFGDPVSRLLDGTEEVNGGLGTEGFRLVVRDHVVITDGPLFAGLQATGTVAPASVVWWAVVVVALVWAVVAVARRRAPAAALAAVGGAVTAFLPYAVLTPIAARFLLPFWLLAAVTIGVVLDAAWRGGTTHRALGAVAALVLVALLPWQLVTLDRVADDQYEKRRETQLLAAAVAARVGDDCALLSEFAAAELGFATGCAAVATDAPEARSVIDEHRLEDVAVLSITPPVPGDVHADWTPQEVAGVERWHIYTAP